MKIQNKYILIGLIACSIALMQFHAIQFWDTNVDPKTGWAWSIMLEAWALALWWRPGWWRVVAMLASILLLGGPLHQISAPLFQARGQLGNINAEITTYQNTLDTALMNSQKRYGWFPMIKKAQEQLQAARDRREAFLQANPSAGNDAFLVVLMQAAALLVIWMGTVSAISSLSKAKAADPGDDEPADVAEGAPLVEITPGLIRAINTRLDAELQQSGQTQGAWADKHGFERRDLSFIRRHFERASIGEQTASIDVIQRLAEALNIPGSINP